MKLVDISKVSVRFQVVIPKEVREKMKLKEGDKIAFYEDEQGNIIIKKI